MRPPIMASFGVGDNSTALLCGLIERGERLPDSVLFADTGGERPETYDYLSMFDRWWQSKGGVPIITVRAEGVHKTLEGKCLTNETLPSLAFGWRSCSDNFKIKPQDKWTNAWKPAREAWSRGEKVVKYLGFDADETHRARKGLGGDKYALEFPLIEWDWGRDECRDAILRAGLPLPGKSACFFCPASKKREVIALAKTRPALFERAVEMERRAKANTTHPLGAVKGLGRHWSWEEIVVADEAQLRLFPETVDTPCICADGGGD